MNKELFYQLAHQASFWCDQNIPEQFSEEIMGYGEAWEEKFAELIVRECCDVFVELRTRPADLAVKDVKKHFGVEE